MTKVVARFFCRLIMGICAALQAAEFAAFLKAHRHVRQRHEAETGQGIAWLERIALACLRRGRSSGQGR